MIVMPAIDLREGACVQLVGGSYEQERVRERDPLAVAARWAAAGFRWLHVVDLDAATGRGSNRDLVRSVLSTSRAAVQVGGGVRTDRDVDELLDAGAARVVVGTRALEDPAWIEGVAARLPNRVVVALDVRGRRPLMRGWTARSPRGLRDALRDVAALPLAGLLVTAVHVEGRMAGPDLPLVSRVSAATRVPVIASGGIASLDDLTALSARGAAAAVVGMALYTGAIDPELAARTYPT